VYLSCNLFRAHLKVFLARRGKLDGGNKLEDSAGVRPKFFDCLFTIICYVLPILTCNRSLIFHYELNHQIWNLFKHKSNALRNPDGSPMLPKGEFSSSSIILSLDPFVSQPLIALLHTHTLTHSQGRSAASPHRLCASQRN